MDHLASHFVSPHLVQAPEGYGTSISRFEQMWTLAILTLDKGGRWDNTSSFLKLRFFWQFCVVGIDAKIVLMGFQAVISLLQVEPPDGWNDPSVTVVCHDNADCAGRFEILAIDEVCAVYAEPVCQLNGAILLD